jgi:hypothetical protein
MYERRYDFVRKYEKCYAENVRQIDDTIYRIGQDRADWTGWFNRRLRPEVQSRLDRLEEKRQVVLRQCLDALPDPSF